MYYSLYQGLLWCVMWYGMVNIGISDLIHYPTDQNNHIFICLYLFSSWKKGKGRTFSIFRLSLQSSIYYITLTSELHRLHTHFLTISKTSNIPYLEPIKRSFSHSALPLLPFPRIACHFETSSYLSYIAIIILTLELSHSLVLSIACSLIIRSIHTYYMEWW